MAKNLNVKLNNLTKNIFLNISYTKQETAYLRKQYLAVCSPAGHPELRQASTNKNGVNDNS